MFKLHYPRFWSRKGLFAILLLVPSRIYLFLTILRQIFVKPIQLPAKVICVGNVTVGGTGKTQITRLLAKMLSHDNIKFVIVTKAYKSRLKSAVIVSSSDDPLEVGDESIMLAKYATVIATPNIQNCLALLEFLKPEVIITDDGMQNPSFKKDCIILSIDGMRGFGNNMLIPAGPLRQNPLYAFAIVDAVVIVQEAKNPTLRRMIGYCKKPIFNAISVPTIAYDSTVKYFAFSGIGNPDRFLSTLKLGKLNIVGSKAFSDHHHYSDKDYLYLQEQSRKLNAVLITTSKDYVKVRDRLQVKNFDVELSIPKLQELQNVIYDKIF